MSLILDALNKADNERSKSAGPSINSNHDPAILSGEPSHNRTLIYALWASIAVLIAVLIVLVMNNSDEKKSEKQPTLAEVHKSDVRNVSKLPATKPSIPTAAPQPDTPETEEKPASKYNQMKEKLIAAQYEQAAEEENKKTTPKKDNPIKSNSKVASIYDKAKQPPKAKPKPTPKVKTVPSLKDYPLLGFIRDLPYSVQQSVPTLMYTEHAFKAKTPYVILNNAKRSKGQLVTGNIYLDEIVADGIVLRVDSRKFKMSALNSWINM